MSRFWPHGLTLNDSQTPLEILRQASTEWASESNGELELLIDNAVSQNGHSLLIVNAMHSKSRRTAALFSVVFRKGYPYPAKLQPKDGDLPDLFKKRYVSRASYTGVFDITSERTVENKWVSETPSEFRENLESVFNLGSIKSEILNLITATSSYSDKAELKEEVDTHGSSQTYGSEES